MVSGLAIAFVACDRCDHSDKVPEVEGLHDHRVRRKLIRVGRRSVVAGQHDQSSREAGPEPVQVRHDRLGPIGTCEGVGDDHIAVPAVDRRAGSTRIFDYKAGVAKAFDQRGSNVVVVLDHKD